MISLNAKIRQAGSSADAVREQGRIPAVVYGHKVANISLDVDYKEFEKVLDEAGESTLIQLSIEGEKEKRGVLVHELQKDPVTDEFTHIDFFQASLTEKVEVEVPLVFEGEALAVKDLGGTLVRNISEIAVKALAKDLPHEIKVSIEGLKTLEDRILVKDIQLPKGVETTLNPEEIIASVAQQENIEAELETPIEEKVEDVEKVEKEKKEDEIVEDTAP